MTPFGHCLTGHHDSCKTEFTSSLTNTTHRCSCKCHDGKD